MSYSKWQVLNFVIFLYCIFQPVGSYNWYSNKNVNRLWIIICWEFVKLNRYSLTISKERTLPFFCLPSALGPFLENVVPLSLLCRQRYFSEKVWFSKTFLSVHLTRISIFCCPIGIDLCQAQNISLISSHYSLSGEVSAFTFLWTHLVLRECGIWEIETF